MFARKSVKSNTEVINSLQRFTDIRRDSASRAKHLRLCLDALNVQEKRQLLDDYSFETFHLVDELLLCVDLAAGAAQCMLEAESALWTLEQVLCLAPELVGRGWQRHAIQSVLKRALFPHNLLAVRKIAIRLFLLWYQSLAVCGGNAHDGQLDTVFQCLLPYFPLDTDQSSTIDILQEFCESSDSVNGTIVNAAMGNGYGSENEGGPGPARNTPLIVAAPPTSPTTKERAQFLQVYLDKFLEYCCRETMRLEWTDTVQRRRDCAAFLMDRVIELYIAKVFPDLGTNGIDVYGGWEGCPPGDSALVMETGEPRVIARYWLVRWMAQIACADAESPPGYLLYRQVLYGSPLYTNTLLTLLREGMQLPLACSHVQLKVVRLIASWLLQTDTPAFVASSAVDADSASMLLLHLLTCFFHSPYLDAIGERVSAAWTVAHAILDVCRQFVTKSLVLPPASQVWRELVRRLTDAVGRCTTRTSGLFYSLAAGGLTQTLLGVCLHVAVEKNVELDTLWDDVAQVSDAAIFPWVFPFEVVRRSVWRQTTEQWSAVADSATIAMMRCVFGYDSDPDQKAMIEKARAQRRSQMTEMKTETPTPDTASDSDRSDGVAGYGRQDSTSEMQQAQAMLDDEQFLNGLAQIGVSANGKTRNVTWLRAWMRIVSVASPMDVTDPELHLMRVQTVARIQHKILTESPGGNSGDLVRWLIRQLAPVLGMDYARFSQSARALLPGVCAALPVVRASPELEARILGALSLCLSAREELSNVIIEHLRDADQAQLRLLADAALTAVQRQLKAAVTSPTESLVRLMAILASTHEVAQQILLDLLGSTTGMPDGTSQSRLNVACETVIVNALCLLILRRGGDGGTKLLDAMRQRLRAGRSRRDRVYGLMVANLRLLIDVGLRGDLLDLVCQAFAVLDGNNAIVQGEFQRELVAASIAGPLPPAISVNLADLVGRLPAGQLAALLANHEQFPLPSFSAAQINSIEYRDERAPTSTARAVADRIFLQRGATALVSGNARGELVLTSRTAYGKHCWQLRRHQKEYRLDGHVNGWLRKAAETVGNPVATSNQRNSETQGSSRRCGNPMMAIPVPPLASPAATADCVLLDHVTARRPFLRAATAATKSARSSPTVTSCGSPWRGLVDDLHWAEDVRAVQANFARDLRHLDQTHGRETHKVAVIYVGDGQEDKTSILSNTKGSAQFDAFVDLLAWPVLLRRHQGYQGGLSGDSTVIPYYGSIDAELVLHVSTRIAGDVTQRLKHIGNDEVHIVWSEHSRPYRRETIATRFCDVLIVIYRISPIHYQVRVETQRELAFGPLFDGARVDHDQLAWLVRETVLNASRAYRQAQADCVRPSAHREAVLLKTCAQLQHLHPAAGIAQLYSPHLP